MEVDISGRMVLDTPSAELYMDTLPFRSMTHVGDEAVTFSFSTPFGFLVFKCSVAVYLDGSFTNDLRKGANGGGLVAE